MNRNLHSLRELYQSLKVNSLIKGAEINEKDIDQLVYHLTYDSREIIEGSIFICKGAHFSPTYLTEAINKGAFCYISENRYETEDPDFPYILVTDIRKAMALLASAFYNEAWKDLTLIGITGTKGKSTTTYYVKNILDHYLASLNKPKCAILSGIDVDDGVIFEESHLTTPEAIMLHRHFHNAVTSKREYLAMEVSSQALKYDRTLGITFDVGCYLNIGEDHISPIEHIDFDDYFESKLRLMEQSKIACININGDHADEVCEVSEFCSRLLTFGTDERADIYAHHIVKREKGISFLVSTPSYTEEILLSMSGFFNVENALAAISICYALDIPFQFIKAGLLTAKVPGRMEVFFGKSSKVMVIVDYAHNRMSFDRLFTSTIKEYPNRKITAVFGCPGKKALGRRQELAEIAGRYSKKIFITEEDPGEESLMDICKEIARYVKPTGCDYEIIPDRDEAIRKAITEADENTVILLTGKGRETRQKRGTKYVDCPSDVDYVMKYLK